MEFLTFDYEDININIPNILKSNLKYFTNDKKLKFFDKNKFINLILSKYERELSKLNNRIIIQKEYINFIEKIIHEVKLLNIPIENFLVTLIYELYTKSKKNYVVMILEKGENFLINKLNYYEDVTFNINFELKYLSTLKEDDIKYIICNDYDRYESLKNYFKYCCEYNILNSFTIKLLIEEGYNNNINEINGEYGLVFKVLSGCKNFEAINYLIDNLNKEKITQNEWENLMKFLKSNRFLKYEEAIKLAEKIEKIYIIDLESNIFNNIKDFFPPKFIKKNNNKSSCSSYNSCSSCSSDDSCHNYNYNYKKSRYNKKSCYFGNCSDCSD